MATRPGSGGLTFAVAEGIDAVVNAWQMVYAAYRHRGLICPNAYRLHTAPEAIGHHSAVIVGRIGNVPVTTLTAMADHQGRLPLDRVFGDELSQMRQQGGTLVEVALFADRRKDLAHSTESLFQLMRYAFYYGLWNGSDIVIGVHPRHARFYTRSMGFETIGSMRSYRAVIDQSIILQRLDIQRQLQVRPVSAGLAFFTKCPVPQDVFAKRFGFAPHQLAGSLLEAYLRNQPQSSETC